MNGTMARPTELYAGRGDRDVVPEHTQWCREPVAAHGGTVDVVDLGDVDQVGTAITGPPTWFLQLKSDRFNGGALPAPSAR